MKRLAILTVVPLLAFSSLPLNAQKKKIQVALDPAKAGVDWQIQGEYRGHTINKDILGAEVIARGDGKFEINFLPGGLRGEAGNYKKRVTAKGQFEGERVRIVGPKKEMIGTIFDGVITGKTGKGEKFSLKKVIRESKRLGKHPPKGAIVLYGGPKDVTNWQNGKIIDGHLLGNGCTSKKRFGDHKFHLEFRLSFMPYKRGQGRSNSGVYVQGRYEVQVLDSFGLRGASNECGGIYSVGEPKINMCYPPLTWQTYDMEFRAARYDDTGKKIKNAIVSVWHNGVLIHDKTELKRGVTGGNKLKETAEPGPLYLQGHGGQLQYRNIWVAELAKQ